MAAAFDRVDHYDARVETHETETLTVNWTHR